ncbi:MAG: hypothetical protein ACRDA4_01665 [Filifactoraceae bacterium]
METNEIKIIKDYAEDMIDLFNQSDSMKEGEELYLSREKIYVNKKDFEKLRKILQI